MTGIRLLGVSCSLRNARFGAGSERLVDEIQKFQERSQLIDFLRVQGKILVEEVFDVGRKKGLSFEEIYRTLQSSKGDRGLSNSEAALVAGLWGAHQVGADITHCGLSKFFPAMSPPRRLDELREIVCNADALLISGPVYFGDRGSLAQEFLTFLREDEVCREHVRNKVYGGIAVGAKRNGGQETTLVYQLVDIANLGMLGVGNDSESTSQYGGTLVGGDVGAMSDDDYGIDTAIGTGRRVARVARLLENARRHSELSKPRIAIWLLQDVKDHKGRKFLERFVHDVKSQTGVSLEIMDFTEEAIGRCIACDICPVEIGEINNYRCIIKSKEDLFCLRHADIIDVDAVLVAAYSPKDRLNTVSVYQRFIERTRYIRRDDYVLSDRLVAPFVISEIGSNQNLHIRILTSFIRHHTVLHHPLIGFEHNQKILNWDEVVEQGVSFVDNATRLTLGRLAAVLEAPESKAYNPVGYTVSREKAAAEATTSTYRHWMDRRRNQAESLARRRVPKQDQQQKK